MRTGIAVAIAGWALSAGAAPPPPAAPATAASSALPDAWGYRIARGDTLISIAGAELQRPRDWPGLQRLNRIENPRRLVPGSTLSIPVQWLRANEASAEIVFVQGEPTVQPAAGGAAQPATVGMALREGDLLRTAAGASATLRFADGSRVLVVPESELQLERVRGLGSAAIPDVRMRLQRGHADTHVQPEPARPPRFEMRTPAVNLGVRGTEFRTRLEAADAATRVEVLTGRVAAGTPAAAKPLDVAAGFGARIEPGAAPQAALPLLPAPSLAAAAQRLDRVPLRWQWEMLPGAQAYRAQVIAADDDTRLLLDGRFEGPAARWPDLPDGRYRLRVRGLDAQGLEGRDAVLPFVLKARPEPPFTIGPAAGARAYGPQADFRWARSSAAQRYRLQVAPTPDFATPVFDAADLAEPARTVPLPPGIWHWRVASIAAGDDAGPFGDAQSFEQRAIPASPALEPPQPRDDGVLLRWPAPRDGAQVEFQVARDAGFANPVLAQKTDAAEALLAAPEPGTYFLRARTVEADGFEGPWGAVQQVEVPRSRWWWLLPLLLIVIA